MRNSLLPENYVLCFIWPSSHNYGDIVLIFCIPLTTNESSTFTNYGLKDKSFFYLNSL